MNSEQQINLETCDTVANNLDSTTVVDCSVDDKCGQLSRERCGNNGCHKSRSRFKKNRKKRRSLATKVLKRLYSVMERKREAQKQNASCKEVICLTDSEEDEELQDHSEGFKMDHVVAHCESRYSSSPNLDRGTSVSVQTEKAKESFNVHDTIVLGESDDDQVYVSSIAPKINVLSGSSDQQCSGNGVFAVNKDSSISDKSNKLSESSDTMCINNVFSVDSNALCHEQETEVLSCDSEDDIVFLKEYYPRELPTTSNHSTSSNNLVLPETKSKARYEKTPNIFCFKDQTNAIGSQNIKAQSGIVCEIIDVEKYKKQEKKKLLKKKKKHQKWLKSIEHVNKGSAVELQLSEHTVNKSSKKKRQLIPVQKNKRQCAEVIVIDDDSDVEGSLLQKISPVSRARGCRRALERKLIKKALNKATYASCVGTNRGGSIVPTSENICMDSKIRSEDEIIKQLRYPCITGLNREMFIPFPVTPAAGPRPVVLDGEDIALTHGKGTFSINGIIRAVKHFISNGHSVVKTFLPQHYTYDCSVPRKDAFQNLLRRGHLCLIPSDRWQIRQYQRSSNSVCLYNRTLVQYATEIGGVIISNKSFQDVADVSERWRTTVLGRSLMFTWINDVLMLHKDQYGIRGPLLENILNFT